MAKRSIHERIEALAAIVALGAAADTNGVTIDTAGAEQCDSLEFVANVGAAGDTLSGTVKIELELEHSDDGTTWADCANTDLTNSVTGTNAGTWAVIDADAEAGQVYRVGYIGSKRYVRAVSNITGTHTNGTPIAISAIKGHLHIEPPDGAL